MMEHKLNQNEQEDLPLLDYGIEDAYLLIPKLNTEYIGPPSYVH